MEKGEPAGQEVELNEEEWEKKSKELEALRLEIRGRLLKTCERVMLNDRFFTIYNRFKVESGLEDQSLQDYKAWHILLGSTIDRNECKYFDLPGNQIENYMKKVLEELKNQEKE